MPTALLDFFKALRGSDLEVSPQAQADAARAVRLLGWHDRETLKTALGATLAKTIPDRLVCDHTFDRFFSFDAFDQRPGPAHSPTTVTQTEDDGRGGAPPANPAAGGTTSSGGSGAHQSEGIEALSSLLLSGDTAALAQRLQKAARDSGLTDIWFFTQKGYYTQRMAQAMGQADLDAEIDDARRQATAPGRIRQLTLARKRLFEEVRNHVERMLALYGSAPTRQLHDDFLVSQRLSTIEQRDFARMHGIVRKIARRLAVRHARRRKRQMRGQLDFRKTLRRNAAYGGMLFETFWRSRVVDRPRVVAICDVSGSVRQSARFLLLFLYCLRELVSDIRAFAFTNHLVEVSATFESLPVAQAVDQVMHAVGGSGTDYGQVMRDINAQLLPAIDRRTTVLIIGDARNNGAEAEVGVMRNLYQRARRVIWLNPEPASFWGTGDSEMQRYAHFCHLARECNSVRQLEGALDALLRSHGASA